MKGKNKQQRVRGLAVTPANVVQDAAGLLSTEKCIPEWIKVPFMYVFLNM